MRSHPAKTTAWQSARRAPRVRSAPNTRTQRSFVEVSKYFLLVRRSPGQRDDRAQPTLQADAPPYSTPRHS